MHIGKIKKFPQNTLVFIGNLKKGASLRKGLWISRYQFGLNRCRIYLMSRVSL
jgi:hypothetical protein